MSSIRGQGHYPPPSSRPGPKLGISAAPFRIWRCFQHMSVLDNIMVGRHHPARQQIFLTGSIYWLTGARTEETRPIGRRVRGDYRLPRPPAQCARLPPATPLLWSQESASSWARGDGRSSPKLILLDEPMAGIEPRRKGGHGALHHRSETRNSANDGDHDRARYGRGHGYFAPGSPCSISAARSPKGCRRRCSPTRMWRGRLSRRGG